MTLLLGAAVKVAPWRGGESFPRARARVWRSPASARHLVWLVALVCALALPLGSWLLPGWRALPGWVRWETVRAAGPFRNETIGTNTTYGFPAVAAAPSVAIGESRWHFAKSPSADDFLGASGFRDSPMSSAPGSTTQAVNQGASRAMSDSAAHPVL